MISLLRFASCVALTLLHFAGANELQAQEHSSPSEIKIPWGFQWGESEMSVEQALQQAKTNIVKRTKMSDREVLVVAGFVQRLLQQALFYFQNDGLNEIELQYGNKKWTASQFSDFFDQTRSNIENKYGPGRVITQQKTRDNQEVLETIIGYQWTQVSATLQLFLFTAERGNESFRVVSLHYRGF